MPSIFIGYIEFTSFFEKSQSLCSIYSKFLQKKPAKHIVLAGSKYKKTRANVTAKEN